MKTLRKLPAVTYSAIIFAFLYAPIVILIVFSFNSGRSRGRWSGFTLDWYASLFHNREIMSALQNTVVIALLSAAIATVVGTAAAVGIHAMKRRMRNAVMNLTYLPVLNADIVTGVSMLILFAFLHIRLGMASLLLAHVTFNIPYVILSVMPKLKQLSMHSFEAAMDLGAKPLNAFMKAVLPEIMPGVITGFILAFTLSVDDFVISFFTTGNGYNTLSIAIYSMSKRGINPQINALSSLMFLVVLTLLVIVNARSKGDRKI